MMLNVHPKTSFEMGQILTLFVNFCNQRILTYFIRGSITVWLTSCFSCLDSTGLTMLNWQQIYLFGRFPTSHTGGQRYFPLHSYWAFSGPSIKQVCHSRSQFHKTLRIRKLRICSYGQILTVNLLINCKKFVIYDKIAVNYEENSFMEQAQLFLFLAFDQCSSLPCWAGT